MELSRVGPHRCGSEDAVEPPLLSPELWCLVLGTNRGLALHTQSDSLRAASKSSGTPGVGFWVGAGLPLTCGTAEPSGSADVLVLTELMTAEPS